MASNDQQDKNAYERRSGSSSMEFQALGSCINSGIMKNSVPTSNGTPLPTVKCSVPSGSFFSSMVLNSNTSIGPSSINNAMDATKVIDGLVIGRSSGCSSSSSSMSYRPSAIGWNASSIGGGMEGTQGISQLACDSAFAERAAIFSCFGAFNLSEGGFPRSRIDNSVMPKTPKPNANMVEVTKAAGSPPKEEAYNAENGPKKAGRLSRSSTPGGNESDDAEVSTAREDSSSSEHVTGDVTTLGRKRKLMKQLPKALSASEAGINTKRMEGSEMNYLKYKASEGLVEKYDVKGQGEQSSSKNGKLNASKEDYFHVRAKRGQATNSHSLAERVRREKIRERLKFLQDLVPGCSKVTGKAVMLDEIIKYVQSLQRQVEFLSMKLAAVNPRLDFNIEALIAKDLRTCFGFDSFFAVDVRRFGDGGIFVGNLRRPIEEVIPKLEKKPSDAAGREVVLSFMEEEVNDFKKQVCMVQPKAEMDLQFESTKLSTPWGYMSAALLGVTTFGTIAITSGFFVKPDATFDDYISNVLPLFGGFLTILGVSEIATRCAADRYGVRLSPSFLVPSNWTGCLGVVNNYESLLPNKKALFDIAAARTTSAYVTSLILVAIAFFLDGGSFNGGDNALYIRPQFFYNNPLFAFIEYFVGPYADELGNVLPRAVEGVGVPVDPLAFAGLLGIAVTSLNLLPIGRLEGGRIAQALFGRKTATLLSFVASLLLGIGGLSGSVISLSWGLFATFLRGGEELPAKDEITPLGDARYVWGYLLAVVCCLTLLPNGAGTLPSPFYTAPFFRGN